MRVTNREEPSVTAENQPANQSSDALVAHTTEIVAAFISNNSLPPGDLPSLISAVHVAVASLGTDTAPIAAAVPTPAVPVKKSIGNDFIVC